MVLRSCPHRAARAGNIQRCPSRLQVGHLVEEARAKATSIQQSVSKALTGQSEEGFTMGMRSATPSYAPAPAWVQFLKSGALSSILGSILEIRESLWYSKY